MTLHTCAAFAIKLCPLLRIIGCSSLFIAIVSLIEPTIVQGIQAIRCPAGLYFDIEKQTCDWKDAVKNCKLKNKERKVKPLLYTDEPLCQDGFLACGDATCIERGLFCNGEKDCADGSDENSCGMLLRYYHLIFNRFKF